MKYRKVEIFNGKTFRVPEHIQRIDHESTHGWQLRYGKRSKMFSDFTPDGKGAKAALALAEAELLIRIDKLPAPSRLRRDVAVNKGSDLPVGVSGPIARQREGRNFAEYSFGVTIPRFGTKPTNRNVYIGTESTYSEERVEIALAKAIELRNKAIRAYQTAATRDKRATSRTRERA
ncbi:MAG: hypothetical protein JHC40_21320 [Burkholderiales bacterium]|jgi:hypothetical protein|nr:hypothetical protein [Burkholderiales bacterium]